MVNVCFICGIPLFMGNIYGPFITSPIVQTVPVNSPEKTLSHYLICFFRLQPAETTIAPALPKRRLSAQLGLFSLIAQETQLARRYSERDRRLQHETRRNPALKIQFGTSMVQADTAIQLKKKLELYWKAFQAKTVFSDRAAGKKCQAGNTIREAISTTGDGYSSTQTETSGKAVS